MRFQRILPWAVLGAMLLTVSCGNDGNGPTATEEEPPRAPADLYVMETSSTSISIAWRDLTEEETGFRIERSTGGPGAFAQRDTVPRDITLYADTDVVAGQTYYYRVRSYVRSNSYDPTDPVWGTATTNRSPTVPTSPEPPDQGSGIEEGAILLRWICDDADSGDQLSYDVYFGQIRNDLDLIAGGWTETELAVAEPVVLNAAYFWRVIVRDPKGAMKIGPVWAFNTKVERIEVPAGWLVMGNDNEFPHPGNPVWVESFEIDRNEITNQQYAVFLNEALHFEPEPLIRTSGGEAYDPGGRILYVQTFEKDDDSQITYDNSDSLFLVIPGKESFPVVEVTWQGATVFAQFYGRRLPTEAEWEMAARGNGTENGSREFTINEPDTTYTVVVGTGRTYAWGETLTRQHANYLGSGDPFEGQGRVNTTPVGFFDGLVHGGFQTMDGSSPFGINDLTGNVAEWCFDWYAPYTTPHTPPTEGVLRIVRGGSWTKGTGSLEVWRRDFAHPYSLDNDSGADRSIGFRTAISLP